MGGDCKFTNNLSEKFAWGLRIPGLDHSVRCKYCNTVVKIARGLFALKQHEQSAMHKKNMPSTSSRTPNIAAALYTSCSKETGVLRLCKSFFRREDFENFNIPSELLQLVKNASSKYKEECEVLKARNQRVESQATVFRDEFDIYKRRTPCELKRELKSVDSEIERTQALLEELHSKKSRLSSETASANFLADSQSSDVIAKMFKN